jgi:SAM-dependent methyltransferase
MTRPEAARSQADPQKHRRARASLDAIEQAYGYIDQGHFKQDELTLAGWMLHPRQEITALRLYLNGADLGPVDLQMRADVAKVFPSIPHAAQSGFFVQLDSSTTEFPSKGDIDLVGYADRRPVTRLGTLYRTDLDAVAPTPPAHLMHRVAHTQDGRFFKIWGLKCYGDMRRFFLRHSPFDPPRKLLDWGCGCGRMTAHFLRENSGPEVHGCDVDAEAIAWCRANLGSGRFEAIAPFPPTPYADASFHLVAGYSVFTHLTKEAQFAWLAEIRRILAPGGIFVVTVHGDFASSLAFQGEVGSRLASGICDEIHDDSLNGIVPAGYYRGTFQSEEYTRREWGRDFDILEYQVRGIGNHQDAVVMRRPA